MSSEIIETAKRPSEGLDCVTFMETRTGVGQLISLECEPAHADDVKTCFDNYIRRIRINRTHCTEVSHGGYVGPSRYNIKQFEYAGSMCSFIEALEIKDPPDGRCSFVLHFEYSDESFFVEFENKEGVIAAYHEYFKRDKRNVAFNDIPGFKRHVKCGVLVPWFYAVGNEELMGDYAVPYGIENDPVYRMGKKFVVLGDSDVPAIKTCMGCRYLPYRQNNMHHTKDEDPPRMNRIIYWSDGSVWNEDDAKLFGRNPPRELNPEDLWILEAIDHFKNMLAGKEKNFAINFLDGYKFLGRIVIPEIPKADKAGEYLVDITYTNTDPQYGTVNFSPTEELPTLQQYITSAAKKKGWDVREIQVRKFNNKKWSRKFFKY